MTSEQIGFGYKPTEHVEEQYIPLSQKMVDLKIFEPKLGEEAAAVYPNGLLIFKGKVTKIIKRGAAEPLYKLEDDKGRYELTYASQVVRICDIPDQSKFKQANRMSMSLQHK